MASTTSKNRNILGNLIGEAPAPTAVTNPPTATAAAVAPAAAAELAPAAIPPRVNDRMMGLSRLASGDYVEKTLRLVDPARCRMWARHNRKYALLTPENCQELLEGLRAQNKQEFPAIVRRVTDDPDFDFEVIAGARRHWAVSYLRDVEHREIKYLVEERELDDEQAFRLADVENRARNDLSDYERAVDYLDAIERYYGGVAVRMAERLDVDRAWLSRFLDLAKLPQDVVAAFGDLLQLRESHARQLKAFLLQGPEKGRIISAAKTISADQQARREAGEPYLEAHKVVAALKNAAVAKAPAPPSPQPRVVRQGEVTLFTVKPKGPKRAVVELELDAGATNAEFIAALQAEIDRLRPNR
ncbi:ParB/RepB/Spo0J family partition protein [Caulobacter sp. FWC26]|uniref:ParB/RepB/Spo0J family partition protein n=1 Tax=Caulobacter sp. FWC26 TaxID=69665 RepID=UPI000C151987|nr:ParB/RepB/Spo0J family partition protein [Caulobacter sp. FWC26]AZS19205.1 ParB/RepB/Spo0J family partition protein [Caulobacter sp. FWC26]